MWVLNFFSDIGGGANSGLAGFPANLLYSQIADPRADTQTAKLLRMLFDPAELVGDQFVDLQRVPLPPGARIRAYTGVPS